MSIRSAGVNPDELPVISGTVSDANGEPLQDFWNLHI